MANVRNYEEYRAEVLERLGDDYTVEDLRNTERWRLRVLDMLSGGGSGGGSSDFSTAKVDIYFIFDGEPIVLDSADIEYYIEYPEGAENPSNLYSVNYLLNNGASETHPILYKGVGKLATVGGRKGSNIYVIGGEVPTVTGDIEFDYDTGITIKGDGSITIYLAQD